MLSNDLPSHMKGSRGTAGRLSPISSGAAPAGAALHDQKKCQTLREKVQADLEAQDAARRNAAQALDRQDRQSLGVAMLVEGRPHAFVDFFELTEPEATSSSVDTAAAASGVASDTASAGPASLLLLQEQLVRADAALKAEDPRAAFDAYKQLGRYFTQRMQLERAAVFYNKCREVASSSGWLEGELESSCALGLVYEQLRQPDAAVACHERCLMLALSGPDGEGAGVALADEARWTLVHVYAQQAEQREKAGDLKAAAEFLSKCLDAADQCGDAAAAGAASHRLGLLCAAEGRWQEASQYQAAYVQLSKEAGDAAAESAACRAYAECLRQLGDFEGAIESLEAYLKLQEAAHDGDMRGPALACCQLGCLHYRRGELQQAVSSFERFFELSRSLDQRLLDVARINLGVTRGALQLQQYMGIVANDLPRLLEMLQGRAPRMPLG